MKLLLKAISLNLLALYLADLLLVSFSIHSDLKTLVTAAIVYTFLNKLVKPLIKILLLPINLITLGLFRWAVSVITLILLQLLVAGITIQSFHFSGLEYQGFIIPAFSVSLLLSYIITSISLRAISSSLRWLVSS